jgi:peptidoglycan biosynthesis protein MviN/MurJ (putative lipid II flippase)
MLGLIKPLLFFFVYFRSFLWALFFFSFIWPNVWCHLKLHMKRLHFLCIYIYIYIYIYMGRRLLVNKRLRQLPTKVVSGLERLEVNRRL